MNVPQDNYTEEDDTFLDPFYLAFGTLRQAIIHVNKNMRRVVLPNTQFKD